MVVRARPTRRPTRTPRRPPPAPAPSAARVPSAVSGTSSACTTRPPPACTSAGQRRARSSCRSRPAAAACRAGPARRRWSAAPPAAWPRSARCRGRCWPAPPAPPGPAASRPRAPGRRRGCPRPTRGRSCPGSRSGTATTPSASSVTLHLDHGAGALGHHGAGRDAHGGAGLDGAVEGVAGARLARRWPARPDAPAGPRSRPWPSWRTAARRRRWSRPRPGCGRGPRSSGTSSAGSGRTASRTIWRALSTGSGWATAASCQAGRGRRFFPP